MAKIFDPMTTMVRSNRRQVIWRAIRARGSFTVFDLERDTGLNLGTVRTYVRSLVKANYLQQMETGQSVGGFGRAVWKLVRDVGVEAPRVGRDGQPVVHGNARENLWRTLRIVGSFTSRELAVQASTDSCLISEVESKDYVKHLLAAGYLAVVSPAKPGHRPGTGTQARYRLIKSRNTGPRPPVVQRTKQVFDPNLGKVVWREVLP